MAEKNRLEMLRESMNAQVRAFWLPKLAEAKRENVRLRKELNSITPDAVIDGLVEGWERELQALDEALSKEI